MKALVTGGAGCIGAELIGRLLADGHSVTCFDNMRTGKDEHIAEYMSNSRFSFINDDLLKIDTVKKAVKGHDVVFHLAANSDIKFKDGDPTNEDLEQNIIATYNVLEAMRVNNVKKIVFTSSSAVYGEAKTTPTPESYSPEPISLYGASKAGCETMITAFCSMFEMQAWILRFANIVGPRSRKTGKTVLTEFMERLQKDNSKLTILGDGKQSKSYLCVDECVDGVLHVFNHAKERVNIYNLGPDDAITINDIAKIVIEEMELSNVRLEYTGGDRGWTGDIPRFLLDVSKIRKLGWQSKRKSHEAIRMTVRNMVRR